MFVIWKSQQKKGSLFCMDYQTHSLSQEIHNSPLLMPPSQKRPGNKNKEKTPSTASTRRSSADSLDLNLKFKTELCKYYCMQMECPFADLCCFAHGEHELRSRESIPMKYKTKPCSKFTQDGYCPYGVRCQFIHSTSRPIIKYQRILNQIKNDSELFFEMLDLEACGTSKRPSIFQKLQGNLFQESEKGVGSQETHEDSWVVVISPAEQRQSYRTRYNSF